MDRKDDDDVERKFGGRRKYVGPDGRGLMCHQCMRSDKSVVLYCRRNPCRKRYCRPCINTWYRRLSEKEVQEICPYCRGNCNCKDCLRLNVLPQDPTYDGDPRTRDERIRLLKYLVHFLYPVLESIHHEQSIEKDIEAKIRGIAPSEIEIQQAVCCDDEHVCCDKCRTYIVDFHRSCQSCLCDFCLACCREIQDSSMLLDGTLTCAPEELGGCGRGLLVFNSMFPKNWVAELHKKVESVVNSNHFVDVLGKSQNQCPCFQMTGKVDDDVHQNLRKAASREDSDDNYLYCPSSSDI